ncbi:MAG: hypothetical protein GVY19_03995 [Bacteroidetes bacterium]|nr:hypothetical protein [Bacteroidota bacterium]
MANISIYALIGGFGSIATASIDKIMINKLLGLADTGIYSIAFLFGTVLKIPASALSKSSYGIIADAWKNNELGIIKAIYHKSCLNQLIVGLYLFLLIWLNIDYLFEYLPEEYSKGRYVILFLSVAQLFNMATGINSVMLITSKYYRFHTYLTGILLVALVITNLIFIPLYGISGAALGSAITLLLTNIIRYGLFYIKFKMQPYNYKFLIILLIATFTFFGCLVLPKTNNGIIDAMINGVFITLIYGTFIIVLNLSDDINSKLNDFYQYFKRML